MSTEVIPFIAARDDAQAAAWLEALRQAMPGLKVVLLADMDEAEKAACRVAVVANPDPALLSQLPNLRWVHSVWAGVERLLAVLGHRGIEIVRLVDPQLAETMAEAVLMASLYLHRDMPAYARQQGQQVWQALAYIRPERRTVSLLGLGALGEAAARRLVAAGFKVNGWSRQPRHLAGVNCLTGETGLHELLGQTDILVCLLPLTPGTRGLLDGDALARLRPGASLINFARGPIVVEEALRAALDSGHLKHAVLDVFATEPLPAGAWPWLHPRVTVLPHCSAPTDRDTASAIVAANIGRYLADGILPASVDARLGY